MGKDLFCRSCGERFEEGAKFCQKCGAEREGTSIERAKQEPLIRREEGESPRDTVKQQLNPNSKLTVDEALKQRREQWRERVVPTHITTEAEEVSKMKETPDTPKEVPNPSVPTMYARDGFQPRKNRNKAPIVIVLLLIAAAAAIFFLWKSGIFAKKPVEPSQVPEPENKIESSLPKETSGEDVAEEDGKFNMDSVDVYDPSKTQADNSMSENEESGGVSGTGDPYEPPTEEPSDDPMTEPTGEGSYLLPQSATMRITETDLEGFTKEQCRLARNEIYARHGRKFSNKQLQAYFADQAWYHPTIEGRDFDEKKILNKIEQANLEVIINYEKTMGYRSE